MSLILEPNFEDADRFYEQLMDMHRSLSDEDSAAANARLVLLLANHVGDGAVLQTAIRLAGEP